MVSRSNSIEDVIQKYCHWSENDELILFYNKLFVLLSIIVDLYRHIN